MTDIPAAPLDLAWVRSQFPALAGSGDRVFCANAGGTFVAEPVLAILDDYQRRLRVQPYSPFEPSREAGQAMDRAREGWADALGVPLARLTFGPSSSANSYVMAQALAPGWDAGDEIVVAVQDHEANQGAWRRAAAARGVTVRDWPVDPVTGELDPEDLYPLLGPRTRWVFFTQSSNILGGTNPVRAIAAAIRERSDALVAVDAVAHAPHELCSPADLGVDLYLFSVYKVYGPHQGILYLSEAAEAQAMPQCHYFLAGDSHKRFNPTGPQHAAVAGCAGVLDYFDALAERQGIAGALSRRERLAALGAVLAGHEAALAGPLLELLAGREDVRLLGRPGTAGRSATVSFVPMRQTPAAVAAALQRRGIGAESGHFYAHRLLEALGVDPASGVLRLSFVHYNSPQEVAQTCEALASVLG
ncbi:MAG TPA: aminotransferase class V-fold PLP-dependent enzyme [Pseudohaliea sp.]|nr:aminotransferase class V-fold PLP-dependent enzyme [Pseudohaliea sp.]